MLSFVDEMSTKYGCSIQTCNILGFTETQLLVALNNMRNDVVTWDFSLNVKFRTAPFVFDYNTLPFCHRHSIKPNKNVFMSTIIILCLGHRLMVESKGGGTPLLIASLPSPSNESKWPFLHSLNN